jgi:hypothetical protein
MRNEKKLIKRNEQGQSQGVASMFLLNIARRCPEGAIPL